MEWSEHTTKVPETQDVSAKRSKSRPRHPIKEGALGPGEASISRGSFGKSKDDERDHIKANHGRGSGSAPVVLLLVSVGDV